MKAPWGNKTGFAKAVTVFAFALLVSLGLCGVNYGLVVLSNPNEGRAVSTFLFATAWAELAAILISFLGLVVTAIAWAVTAAVRRLGARES